MCKICGGHQLAKIPDLVLDIHRSYEIHVILLAGCSLLKPGDYSLKGRPMGKRYANDVT